jgi:hypothetical protein
MQEVPVRGLGSVTVDYCVAAPDATDLSHCELSTLLAAAGIAQQVYCSSCGLKGKGIEVRFPAGEVIFVFCTAS